MARSFDATVDFNTPGALEAELSKALQGAAPHNGFSVIIWAGAGTHVDDCEIGLVYLVNEEMPVSELTQDDWCVTADSIEDAARQLRALL